MDAYIIYDMFHIGTPWHKLPKGIWFLDAGRIGRYRPFPDQDKLGYQIEKVAVRHR